ncbi:hypothetical protein [Salinicola tamaricis]|uniref:hypothetical protein n=1 Tax=Salinicola tamaricis TaxID=1771309 RepID=UPI001F5DAB54|nr:hypothetical protein [Salinicola tamaricis]
MRVTLPNVKRYGVFGARGGGDRGAQGAAGCNILDADGKAEARFVSLGEVAGDWQIITQGLDSGDRVVVSGIGSVSPGDKIDPQPFSGSAEDPQDKAGENPSQKADAKGGEGAEGAEGAQTGKGAQGAQTDGGQNGAN